MSLVRFMTLVCCMLIWAVCCSTVWAEAADQEKAPQKEAPKAKVKQAEEPAPKQPVLRERVPMHELLNLEPKPKAKPQAVVLKPVEKKKPARQPLPANRRPPPPFWSPRQGRLSNAATYHLESMGRHVHLSPAMRWHLNRTGATVNVAPNTRLASAATVPGQGAEKFYPGISRLPTQKPFANLERPPSGLERYWPLLLEGREDPNTGLIIWSLP